MYHAIVRRIMRAGFRRMSVTHDASQLVAQFSDDAVLVLSGDHDLGGEQRGREAIARWFARLFAMFPGFAIEPLAIVVAGPPWATTAATRFRITATLPDGSPYTNEGMQFVRIRFGRILEDRIYEDTAKLSSALEKIAAASGARATITADAM